MGAIGVRLMPDGRLVRERDGTVETLAPRVDRARVAATTEAEIAAQEAGDDAEAKAAAGAYARRGADTAAHPRPRARGGIGGPGAS